jgi:MFS family permease
MLPVLARDVLALGPAGLGALVAADGGGALLGALAIATRRGDLGHRMLFGAAVLAAPALLVALSASRWVPVCVILLVAMGVAESAFATMQSTLVLLEAPERVRGGAMGILSACIGTQPVGTLAIGLLAAGIGAPLAFTVNAVAALLVIAGRDSGPFRELAGALRRAGHSDHAPPGAPLAGAASPGQACSLAVRGTESAGLATRARGAHPASARGRCPR